MLNLQDSTDLCRLLSDPTRIRLLSILRKEPLTVAEITAATRLTQSRVSSHLGKLREAKLILDRRAGNSTFYSMAELLPENQRIWEALSQCMHDSILEDDLNRVSEILRDRHGSNWADSVAGSMHRQYSPGRTWESGSRAFLGLMKLGHVLDVASGDGVLAELIAPRAEKVTCLDTSNKVIQAGRKRLSHIHNVSFVQGDMQSLPFANRSFDQIQLLNALTYASDPSLVFQEARRVLKVGGRLIASTLHKHSHKTEVSKYNHCNQGFAVDELKTHLAAANLQIDCCELSCREDRKPQFEIITIHAFRESS